MPRNGKRKRPNDSVPPPPPPPPQALVDLMRSDSSVLEYFASLQTCLTADVDKWKNRALEYKEEAKDLRRQLQQQKQESKKLVAARKRKAKTTKRRTPPPATSQQQQDATNDDSDEDGAASPTGREKQSSRLVAGNGRRAATTTRNESALLFSSDDDDDSSVDAKPAAVEPTMEQEEHAVTDWTVYGLLLQAYHNLRQLGLTLVVEEQTIDEETTLTNEHPSSDASENEEDESSSITYIRRSDEDVIAEMMHAIHTLTRIQLQLKDSNDSTFAPFCISNDATFLPSCCSPGHPAAQGKDCLLQALSVMDVYCNTSMTDAEWNQLFPPETADEAIHVGMRNRRHLVELLLASLSGEISEAWAVADRSWRLANPSVHYVASEQDNEAVPFVGSFGAKSQARLSALAERCFLSEVVMKILHQRDEHQEAASLIWRYILSAVPSFGVRDDYPRLPPVLSLCVLESLFRPYTQSTGTEILLQLYPFGQSPSVMRRAIDLAIRAAACVWKLRLASSDDRITDISRVELAAYHRLAELAQSSCVFSPEDERKNINDFCVEAKTLLRDALSYGRSSTGEVPSSSTRIMEASLAVQLALVLVGDTHLVLSTCSDGTGRLDREWIPLACCCAFRQLQVRQIDALRMKQGSLVEASYVTVLLEFDRLSSIVDGLSETDGPMAVPEGVDAILKCWMQLSDAERIYKLLFRLAKSEPSASCRTSTARVISQCLGTSFANIRAPVVRVINLERRRDRIKTFMAQAQSQRILVSKAVARLDADDGSYPLISPTRNKDFDSTYVWGLHALDGRGGMVEVASRLSKEIGDSHSLSDMVESHWRPNDLKAFDKDARNDESLVLLSPSERACALSHIGSWKGVYRSLVATAPALQNRDDPRRGLSFPFLISGYARGKPLLNTNEHMPPTPVCVILEDDAVLVDRFVDRLSTLLEELPRDFHFCSLGYSRPKTAPIAKYSTHLGIPSCIWYLTGYILSFEGAKYLLGSLPVRGPVDSWIGLKMCANWDNVFGQAMGVGARAVSVTAELPSHKDLARILNFRAFAALVPLCSQKVDSTTNSTVGRSWRQRDTDVTYSGNL